MQAHLPTATALSNLWLLMMLLPGGTEAGKFVFPHSLRSLAKLLSCKSLAS